MKKLTMNFKRQKSTGFSLIELMLAMVLGIILVGGVIEIFISNRASYKTQEGISRIQENGRMLHRFVNRDIRPTAHQGCMNMTHSTPTIVVLPGVANLTFDNDTIVTGHDYDGNGSIWVPALPTWLTSAITNGSIEPGTDVFIVRKLSQNTANITTVMATAADNIIVPDRITLTTNDILLISDCHRSDIFRATTVNGPTSGTYTVEHDTSGNTSASLSKMYQTDAEVAKIELTAYYIKNTGRVNKANNPILSLYRQEFDGTEREIVEGVENIQVVYGLDTTGDGNADTFETAAAVDAAGNWNNVVSMNIRALVTSIEAVNETEQGYTFDGTTISSPGDRVSRRQWDSYVTLRNRTE